MGLAVGTRVTSSAVVASVDDAFMESFLCVRPAGAGTQATPYSLVVLDQFQKDFSKWLRGDPRVKDDRDVTASDIADNNLILFGDPWSNQLIAKIIVSCPSSGPKNKSHWGAARWMPPLTYRSLSFRTH
jgi:hypothetical protein